MRLRNFYQLLLYRERTRLMIVSLISSFGVSMFSGKKLLGLTSSAQASRSRVKTEGCFFPFSRLAKKLCDRFALTDNSSWDMDFSVRISLILPITYCNCLFTSSIENKIMPIDIDTMLYRCYNMLYRKYW